MTSTWPAFLASVDDEAPDEEFLLNAEDFLTKAGLTSPAKALGVRLDALAKHGEWPTDLALQAFVSRALETLEATHRAKSAAAQPALTQQQSQAAPSVASAPPLCVVPLATLPCEEKRASRALKESLSKLIGST